MKRLWVVVLSVALVLAAAGAGVGAWYLVRSHGPSLPEISAYSHGQLVRVEPALYCDRNDLRQCADTHDEGVLAVDDRNPVQLSVPSHIGDSPWWLILNYADPRSATETLFRPGTALAATIPTVDPQRGPLMQIVVQQRTLVVDQHGEQYLMPHAEWSVRTEWN